MKVAILIPAYNEAAYIGDVVAQCRERVPELLVFDDGSTDATVAVARAAGAEVVAHARNLGKGQTLFDGLNLLAERGYDAVLCLDADGQHAPAEIPLFIRAGDDADFVIGNRMQERQTMPLVRWWTNVVTSRVISWLGKCRVHDSQVGYRLVRCAAWRKIRDKIISRNFEFEGEMLVMAGRAGLRVAEVPVRTIYGTETSQINPLLDTWRFIKMAWRLLKNRG
ncbi:dolichol-phosphate mannose synthase [Planctomycetales bacterium]|nr:dolichol-phosphate mannose synthase [Planctomycetales bacterium]GHT00812.1 dolichol-phosphate mannose synthase [Planctomycetales bacterium]GHT06603.1 dolichol-phosphate mannose synthase [Planctomycetales bacterium]